MWHWPHTLTNAQLLLSSRYEKLQLFIPDSKVHGANMGPIWGRQVGPMWATWKLLSGMLTRPLRQAPFDTVHPKELCTRLAFCCNLLRIYTSRFYTYPRVLYHWNLGPDSYQGASKAPLVLYSLRRHRLFRIGIPIINLRRSADRLWFIMRITLPVRWLLYTE